MSKALGLFATLALLGGCTALPPPLYDWGSYEELIYASYAAPGSIAVETQVETLEMDYQLARAANRQMPPGWHAHLGYLYFQLGRLDQAQQSFLTEKAAFPESAVLMDRLVANLKK